jgi:SAM-dependent methyltransferase
MDLREIPSQPLTRHPWEVERAAFFAQVASRHAQGRPLRVLDVGAGDGYVARTLLDRLPTGSSVVCFDAHYSPEHLREFQAAAPKGITFQRELPRTPFDLIVMLDVIEHVPDDRAFLEQIKADCLRAEGRVLVSVPAHPALYTQHDVALGHYRRYTAAALRGALTSAGLTPVDAGGLFGLLIPARALGKLVELARGVRAAPDLDGLQDHVDSGLSNWGGGPLLTALVQQALRFDIRLAQRAARLKIALPGLSVWAIARPATS